MIEQDPGSPLSLAEYERRAVVFRRDGNIDWQLAYSDYFHEELFEALSQHGPSLLLLLPEDLGVSVEADQTLRHRMAGEFGDILWYTFDTASRLEIKPADACLASLRCHGQQPGLAPISFAAIEAAAIDYADHLSVLTKASLESGYELPADVITSLASSPGYFLVRSSMRLSRILDGGTRDAAPFSASELEPLQDVEPVLGDLLFALAYITSEKLHFSLENIASYSLAKLQHRTVHGKEDDIGFEEWLTRSAGV